MSIDKFLKFFVPKDHSFFPLFEAASSNLVKAAQALKELMTKEESTEHDRINKEIKAIEHIGDEITNKTYEQLNKSFITPFDREDMTELTDTMDDVIDVINRVAQKVTLFSPETFLPATLEMATIIKKGTAEIKSSIHELTVVRKSDAQIKKHIKEIKNLEEEADRTYEKGTSNLFKSDIQPVELIKLKEIIQELEKAANRINAVGKILKTIVVKYA